MWGIQTNRDYLLVAMSQFDLVLLAFYILLIV